MRPDPMYIVRTDNSVAKAPHYEEFDDLEKVAKQCDPVQWERVEGLTTPPSLKEEDKPVCFGCYGYRICVERNKLPSICKWENRCYNSQRDY